MDETVNTITNTHILVQDFEYIVPASVGEAVEILARHRDHARILAGGTDLLVQMKMEREKPGMLVDIRRIPGLDEIRQDKDGLRVGALVTHWQLERSTLLWESYTALAEAATHIGGVQIRAMGTVGGNLGNASPAADTVPPFLAMDASVRLEGPDGDRVVPMSEFFVGPGQSVREPDEIIIEVLVPAPDSETGSGFTRLTRVASDLAKVNVAALIERDGEKVGRARIALGSVYKTPLRALEAEQSLVGQPFSEELAEQAGEIASGEILPITDLRSTKDYRLLTSKVLARDALMLAWSRSLKGGT